MAGETKERILETSLALFAQRGYSGVSMRDIAEQLGVTKGALYKHYDSKQAILDGITRRMTELDDARAHAYRMPENQADGFAGVYQRTPAAQIRAYSKAQFRHWTEEPFPCAFRRMLTLEQFRDPALGRLYQQQLVSGPLAYMAEIFRRMTGSVENAMPLALEFYGPIFLLYSVYDGAADKASVLPLLCAHIDRCIARMETGRKAGGAL